MKPVMKGKKVISFEAPAIPATVQKKLMKEMLKILINSAFTKDTN